MKTIKDYIQFAIDNGYYADRTFRKLDIIKNVKFTYEEGDDDLERAESYSECKGLYILDFIADVGTGYKNIIEIITSKEFIEAIARGIENIKTEEHQKTWGHIIENGLTEQHITIQQAFAIRDGKLQEFINNILNEGK